LIINFYLLFSFFCVIFLPQFSFPGSLILATSGEHQRSLERGEDSKLEEILHEFKPEVLIPLRLGGLDLSITDYVVWLLVACVLVFVLLYLAARRASLVPRGFYNAIETVVEFIYQEMILNVMGPEGKPFLPFIATIFFFIFFVNLMGLIPIPGLKVGEHLVFPGMKTSTSLTGTTFAWGLLVFLVYNLVGIKKQGIIGYLKSIVPSGVPFYLIPFLFLLELISHIFRPVSLAIRLFANMLAGHTVLAVFTFMAATSIFWVKLLPFAGVVIIMVFEIFVSFIQAYIFSILTAIYISGAVHAEH